MVRSNDDASALTWARVNSVGIAAVLVGGAFAVFGGEDSTAQNGLSDVQLSELKADLRNTVKSEVANSLPVVNQSDETLTKEMHDKMFEEDAWDAEAEILALEEIEEDDYEEIFDYLNGLQEENVIDDEDDIEEVVVRDVKVTYSDSDDRDATVTYKLRVYYENSEGDNKKETIYARAEISDGEVDKLKFSDNEDFVVSED